MCRQLATAGRQPVDLMKQAAHLAGAGAGGQGVQDGHLRLHVHLQQQCEQVNLIDSVWQLSEMRLILTALALRHTVLLPIVCLGMRSCRPPSLPGGPYPQPHLRAAVLDVLRRVHQLQDHGALARPGRQAGAVDGRVCSHSIADAAPTSVPLRPEQGRAQQAGEAQGGGTHARQPRQQVRQQRPVVLMVEVVVQDEGDVLQGVLQL